MVTARGMRRRRTLVLDLRIESWVWELLLLQLLRDDDVSISHPISTVQCMLHSGVAR